VASGLTSIKGLIFRRFRVKRRLRVKIRYVHLAVAAIAFGAAVATAAPRVTQDGSVAWVTGGVTGDERAELVLQLPDYNLRIVTAAQRSGSYLSDVALAVRDAKGAMVLQITIDGPMLYARMPPGRYDLELTWGGVTQKRAVVVPPTGRREAFFYWQDPTADEVKATDEERGVTAPGKR
jgi:hypothetical protein